MGLNIKSEKVHRLARKVAAETGTSMTSAIETALREKLERLAKRRDAEARIARVRRELDKLGPPPAGLSSDHSDLYDEEGLPA
jgi:antitoxin VapB